MPVIHRDIERYYESIRYISWRANIRQAEFITIAITLLFLGLLEQRLSTKSGRKRNKRIAGGQTLRPATASIFDALNVDEGQHPGTVLDEIISEWEVNNPILHDMLPSGFEKLDSGAINRLLANLRDYTEKLESNELLGEFEYAITRFIANEERSTSVVPKSLSVLISNSIDTEPRSVLETGGTVGQLLIQTLDRLFTDDTSRKSGGFLGFEPSSATVKFAFYYSILNNITANFNSRAVLLSKAHSHPGGFDLVLSASPSLKGVKGKLEEQSTVVEEAYSFPETQSGRWISYVLSLLAENGTAVLVLPNSAFGTDEKDASLRRYLVDMGYVKAVVALGSRSFPASGAPRNVWFLSKANWHRDGILFIDARQIVRRESMKHANVLSHYEAEFLSNVIRYCRHEEPRFEFGTEQITREAFPHGEYRDIPGLCCLVDKEEITSDLVSLDPEEYIQKSRVLVEELRLRHFRSFEDTRLRLDDITVIVGKNGSGKTTLMEAFDFIRDALTDSLGNALERRDGLAGVRQRQSGRSAKYDVSVAIKLRINSLESAIYGFKVGTRSGGGDFQVKEEVLRFSGETKGFHRKEALFQSTIENLAPVIDIESLALPSVAGLVAEWKTVLDTLKSIYTYSLSPEIIRMEPPIGSKDWLDRDGGNTGDVLKRLQSQKKDMDWILKRLAAIAPGITNISAGARGGKRIITFRQRFSDAAVHEFTPMHMSDGTLRALGVLLALRQLACPSLVFIDELEDSIHPSALGVLIEAVLNSLDRLQVIISSHSPEALSHDAIVGDKVRVVEWRSGISHTFDLSSETKSRIQPPRTVGNFLRANALWHEDTPTSTGYDVFDVTS